MNSEQPSILSGYNLWELMAKEVRRPGEKEKAQTITEILKQPDNTEEVNMGRALTSLSKGLDDTFGVGLSGICGGDSVKAKLFRPHECVLCSYYGMPVELNTSVTAFGAHTSGEPRGKKTGSVMLFKLSANLPGESAPSSTARDLEWGVNCIRGAFVTGGKINCFEIAQTSGDDIVVVELHPFGERALNLSQELGKFIASREESSRPAVFVRNVAS